MIRKQDALDYHRIGRPGKLEVVSTKPLVTQRDLSLAYSPGVAEPCLEIAANPEMGWEYTARGNLVAVVSNGTAVPLVTTATRFPRAVYLYTSSGLSLMARHGSATPGE
jgi:hypothetical protein